MRTVEMPIAMMVAVAAAALVAVRFSSAGRPALQVASRALLAAAVLGSFLNDSGVIVAAAVVAVAWPAGVVLNRPEPPGWPV